MAGTPSNAPFASGYRLASDKLGNAGWTEVLSTDAEAYAGWNAGNAGRTLRAIDGAVNVGLSACGVVVFRMD